MAVTEVCCVNVAVLVLMGLCFGLLLELAAAVVSDRAAFWDVTCVGIAASYTNIISYFFFNLTVQGRPF